MMTTGRRLAFLGAGNMARALLRGCLERAGVAPEQLGATDVSSSALEQVRSELAIRTFASNAAAVRWAEVIVLAVKPQIVPTVLAEIAPELGTDKLVISIAAGVPTAHIEGALAVGTRVVRAMPNTPAMVGEAATAIAAGSAATADDMAQAEALFGSVGIVVRTAEGLMDAVTGLSGSGPGYVFIAIEALSDAGVRAGLPREVATKLAAQTLLGAAKLALESGEHPGRLKDMVTSPAGTTIAGVAALERAGFRHALLAAVEAAVARSKELGRG
jgi:pyrroline-5-carboxylate reductase